MNNENLQRGMDQNYAMKIAGKLNWIKRSLMGFRAQVNPSLFFAIVRDPEYNNMSQARKEHLALLETTFAELHRQADTAIGRLEEYGKLPKYTPEYTEQKKQKKQTKRITVI